MWFEEPCQWQNDRRAMRDVRLAAGVPVCAGQSEFSAAGCRDLMETGSIDYCNFDSSWSGGPTEWRRAASIASVYDVRMAHHEEPQVPSHLLASIPHGTYLEYFHPMRDPIWHNLVANRPELRDGASRSPRARASGGAGTATTSTATASPSTTDQRASHHPDDTHALPPGRATALAHEMRATRRSWSCVRTSPSPGVPSRPRRPAGAVRPPAGPRHPHLARWASRAQQSAQPPWACGPSSRSCSSSSWESPLDQLSPKAPGSAT
jgi:hypothetical protein